MALTFGADQSDKIADGAVRFHWMTQRSLGQDAIVVLSPDFLALDKTIKLEVRDDSLYRSLRDADFQSDFPQDQ